MFIKQFALVIIVLLIISCAGPMDSTESDEGIKLFSIKNGSIIETGSVLPVTLVYNESGNAFDYLKILLFDDEGKEIAVNKIERSSIRSNRKKEIILPENLEKGIYHVKFEVYNFDKKIFSSVTDFFAEKNSYKLNNIQSYPPNPAPGEKVLLIADFSTTEVNRSSDPYFRWIMGKNILYEGYYSKGANKYNWTTPYIEGAYSITVELFPFKPLEKVFEKFDSAILITSSAIVSESNRVRTNEFLPEASYSTLFHLRGEISDSGYLAAADNANFKVVGEPSLDFKGGIYGYCFKKNEYIEIPSLVIPFSKEGVLQPFSIKFKFIDDNSVSTDPSQNVFFNSFTENEGFGISLGQEDRTQYFCEIVSGLNKFKSKAIRRKDTLNSPLNLTVSFYPNRTSCTVVWIMNGETVLRDDIPFLPGIVEEYGRTTISSGLYPKLYDEIGIYTKTVDGKNSADPSCFKDYNTEIFGKSLLFAEGFESMETVSPLRKEGAVVNNGQAVIKPNGWICVGNKIQLSGNMEVNIKSGDCNFAIRDQAGADVFSGNVKEGSENILINNITSGNYDIYVLNNDKSRTTFVESVLITKVH